MAKIKVSDAVKDKVPKELADMEQGEYRLTKIGAKRDRSQVSIGQFEEGALSVVEYGATGLPAVLVAGERWTQYIRTSPVERVTEVGEGFLCFETEGGFYKLERKQE